MKQTNRSNHKKSAQDKMVLFNKVISGESTDQELMQISLLRGIITQEQYEDYLKIEEDCNTSDPNSTTKFNEI